MRNKSNNTILFSFIIILFNSCLGNFNHHTKEKIIGDYYIIATDNKSQATISIYKKSFESYIGITPEGIVEYTVIGKEFIVGKSNKNDYFVIEIGKEAFKQLSFIRFKEFLVSKKTDAGKIRWKKL